MKEQKVTSHVRTLTEEQIQKLEPLLYNKGWEIKPFPHAHWQAKLNKTTITPYKSGKLTVQGRDTAEFVTFILEPEILGEFIFGYEKISEDKTPQEPFAPHAGVDESGKGDFFGPLVVAAAYVDTEETAKKLKKAGTRDSKTISVSKIPPIANEIRKILNGKFTVIPIGPEAYNKLYSKIRNLNRLLAWGHARAIENILERVPSCPSALSDKFGDERLIQRALLEKGRTIKLNQRTKAESDIAVAAASILARDIFLSKMKALSDDCGIIIPRGGGGEKIRAAAAKITAEKGPDFLGKIAKLHFSTAAEFLQETPLNREKQEPS